MSTARPLPCRLVSAWAAVNRGGRSGPAESECLASGQSIVRVGHQFGRSALLDRRHSIQSVVVVRDVVVIWPSGAAAVAGFVVLVS